MNKADFPLKGIDQLTANSSSGVNSRHPARNSKSFLNAIWRGVAGGVRRVSGAVTSINLNRGENISEFGPPAVTYKKGNGFAGKVTSVDNGADVKAQSDSENVSCRKHPPLKGTFSFHDNIHIGVGISTDNRCVVEVRDRRTDNFYVAKPIKGGHSKDREIKFLKKIKEDNNRYIANIIVVTDDHIIMEDGGTNLKKIIEDEGTPDTESIGKYITHLIKGLCYLLEKGIIHGDIKPDNLLIRNEQLKICDFGIAREQGENYKGMSPVSYTPLECLKSGESENIDIWSAGCVLYFLTTGEKLFPADFILDSGHRLKVTDQKMEERIKEASHTIEKALGEDAKDLFGEMIALKSGGRISPGEALQHRYIKAAEQKPVKYRSAKISSQGDVITAVETGRYIRAGRYIRGRSISSRQHGYIKVSALELELAGFRPAKVSTPGSAFDNPEYMTLSRLLSSRSYAASEYVNL
ncbi:protein kinase domain-containing protein [Endozoicomonas sp.]|uniref:protein kinase domain-containing protein n=1 Tax=Endozoicomonas sp. TaxID=1892382 RepID=UPI00288855CA|nr:protein kinase [Endozoicomonas sp.]